MAIDDTGVIVRAVVVSRASMLRQFASSSEIECDRSVRIGRQFASLDHDVTASSPFFLAQINEFEERVREQGKNREWNPDRADAPSPRRTRRFAARRRG